MHVCILKMEEKVILTRTINEASRENTTHLKYFSKVSFFVSLSVSIGDLTVFSVISRFNLVSVCREILTDKKLNSQSIFSTGDIFFSDRQKSDRKN